MASIEGTDPPASPSKKQKMHNSKRMHLNFFELACNASHMCTGQWKDPADNTQGKSSIDHYLWLAKLAEKGKITSIFFADVYGIFETYQGKPDAIFAGGSMCAYLDPVVMISAMATVTKSVSFGITGSTSYIAPFILARTWATLDHITKGRVAWNVVTSFNTTAAQAMGLEDVKSSAERYEAAHEYMDLCYQLWEQSWEDGAMKFQVEPEMAYDASKIHKIHFDGKHHKCHAYAQTHPSPQRTPVIFQAGASKSGIDFAGKHAEAIYTDNSTIDSLAEYVRDVRAAAVRHGRHPSAVKIFMAMAPILGKTQEEAQAKHDHAKSLASTQSGLAKFSGYTNVDLSQYPLHEPFDTELKHADNQVAGVIKNYSLKQKLATEPFTPEYIGKMAGFGSTPKPTGTASHVADILEDWFHKTDIDGFNLVYVSNPVSYEDVVELLVPELQERGLMWRDYLVEGGTFRENLHGVKGEPGLAANHPGSRFKWNAPGGPLKGAQLKVDLGR